MLFNLLTFLLNQGVRELVWAGFFSAGLSTWESIQNRLKYPNDGHVLSSFM